MSDSNVPKPIAVAEGSGKKERRGPAQVTLSTIGDVAVASSDVIAKLDGVPRKPGWRSLLAFFLFVYGATLGVAWLLTEPGSWPNLLLAVLFPVLCATAAFWWRQQWKFRARESRFKLKVWQEALDSVGYEAINAVNAIRANLIGFRLANPTVSEPKHLEVIEDGAKRIDAAIQQAQDPVRWYARKKNKKKEESPSQLGEDTRSRINL